MSSCTTISKIQQKELEGYELDYHCKAMDQTYDDNMSRFLKYDRKAQNFGKYAERKIDNRKKN